VAHFASGDELGEDLGRVRAEALAEPVRRHEPAHAQGVQHERLVDIERLCVMHVIRHVTSMLRLARRC
jgi:hypothetical protein